MPRKGMKVYMFDEEGNFLKEFETTEECAIFFEKEPTYINHSLVYNSKIRKDGKWYKISRKKGE